jgi:hypothetical protein
MINRTKINKNIYLFHTSLFTLSTNVRIPPELYQKLRKIRISLDSEYYSAAPTIQDLVTIAIKRLIEDWEDSEEQNQLLDELLNQRQQARSRMGKKNKDSS